jgi:vacuolar-type H+-ATPase subunit C/Vma6
LKKEHGKADMALFDYGNTRLRARLSEALDEETLESFCDLPSLDSFISALTKTPYQQSIETALTLSYGYSCILETKRLELINLEKDLNRFYEGDAHSMVMAIFWQEDLTNLKAIIRGIGHRVPMELVTEALTPLGTIPYRILEDIARSKNLEEVISRIVVHQLMISKPLLLLQAMKEESDSVKMEMTIEQYYFEMLPEIPRGNHENIRLLKDWISFEADVINLTTVIRKILESELNPGKNENPETYLVHSGKISMDTWMRLTHESQIEDLIESLYKTRYQQSLRTALSQYQETNQASVFEYLLRAEMLKWEAKLPRKYPLGIGVPLGYVAIKKNELRNLVWIAKGILSGFEPHFIKANLVRI